MSWVVAGVALGTAALSAYQQKEQQKAAKKQDQASMMANASNLEFSPWTGFQGGVQGAKATGTDADVLGAGAQGGMQGFLFSKQLGAKTPPGGPQAPMQTKPLQSSWTGMESQYQAPKPSLFNPNPEKMYG